MSQRVERQARDLYNYYVKEVAGDEQPLAINSTKFAEYVAKKCDYSLRLIIGPMGFPLRDMIVKK